MKIYRNEDYKLCDEVIELCYDTINNHMIQEKEHLVFEGAYIENECYFKKKTVKSYFVADDELGIGICTEVDDKKETTYYEDEEWCMLFSSIKDIEYYDDFYNIDGIQDVISWNISLINNDLFKIIDRESNVLLLDDFGNTIGIAKECYFINENNDKYEIVLNKIITRNMEDLDIKEIAINFSDEYLKLPCFINKQSKIIMDGIIKVSIEVEDRNSRYTSSRQINDKSFNDFNFDDYDDSDLDLTTKDIKNICLFEELYRDRKEEFKEFKDNYRYVFKKYINLAKYLIS